MLRRPTSSTSCPIRTSSSRSLHPPTLTPPSFHLLRSLSSSPHVFAYKRNKDRFKTERDNFPRPAPILTKQEQLEEDLTKQLTNAAGQTFKQKMAGIKIQTRYFREQVYRQDRQIAIDKSLEGLPPLTEAEVDDFYINLFASGNELGNLPSLESPTHRPGKPDDIRPYSSPQLSEDDPAAIEAKKVEEKFWLEMEEEQKRRRQALATPGKTGTEVRQAMMTASGVKILGQPEEQPQQEEEEEAELEMVGVEQTRGSRLSERLLARDAETGGVSDVTPSNSSLSPSPPSPSSQFTPSSTQQSATASLLSIRREPRAEPPEPLTFEQRYPRAHQVPPKISLSPYEIRQRSRREVNEPASPNIHQLDPSSLARPSVSPSFNARPPEYAVPPGLHPNSPHVENFEELAGTAVPPVSAVPPLSYTPPRRRPEADSKDLSLSRYPAMIPLSAEISPNCPSTWRPPRSAVILGVEAAVQAAESTRSSPPSLSSGSSDLPRSLNPLDRSLPGGGLHLPTKRDPGPPSLAGSTESSLARPNVVPMGLLTRSEWKSEVYDALSRSERSSPLDPVAARRTKEIRKILGRLPALSREEKFEKFTEAGAALEAAHVLDLMLRSGSMPEKEWYLDVMKQLGEAGDSKGLTNVIKAYEQAGFPVSGDSHGYLVLAHLSRSDLHSAVATLHDIEDKDLYPSQSIYRSLLAPLVNSPVSHQRATGWDLFAHMRLVAHGLPSKELYETMIAACGHKDHPEPERGLDLFKEMTSDNQLQPDVSSYNAAIYAACTNSVRNNAFYLEGFRLMRQMLDFYHLAAPGSEQRALYTPNRETFDSLLEGAKRAGDIARARWILTEMIRFSNHAGLENDGEAIAPTSHTMANVFQTYSSAQPKITKEMVFQQKRRELAGIEAGVEEEPTLQIASGQSVEYSLSTSSSSSSASPSKVDLLDAEVLEGQEGGDPARLSQQEFEENWTSSSDDPKELQSAPQQTSDNTPSTVQTSPLPQSAQEILYEADRLLHHVVTDHEIYTNTESQRTPTGSLPSLRFAPLTTRLLNVYLVVHYKHNELQAGIEKFDTAFAEHDIRRNGYSYRDVMYRLKHTRSDEREEAARIAMRIFKEWELYEAEGEKRIHLTELEHGHLRAREVRESLGLGERNIESIWVIMIHIMASADQLSLARSIIERFVHLYPPSNIRKAHLPALPSRALVRMIPRHEIRPDPLPPHLLWPNVACLHQRYVLYQQAKGMAYLKWVTKSYEGALKRYREDKLNDGQVGATRKQETDYNQRLVEVAEEKRYKGPTPFLQKKWRGLKDFEGSMGTPPEEMQKWKKTEWKIRRQHGEEAVGRYQRALRQW